MNQYICGIQDAPEHLRHNEFIHHGYRKNFNTYKDCIKSLFLLTNESVNIWSHLLGSILFIFLTFSINDFVRGVPETSAIDHVVVTVFCLSFLTCLVFSTAYHIFNCQSKEQADCCFRLDLAGIGVSLCGIYLPSYYYAFICIPFWRMFYSGATLVLIIINILFQVLPRRLYSNKADKRRIYVFIFMVLFGIIPACHWIYLHGGFGNAFVQNFVPKIFLMYFTTGLAFFFYASKIPEKYYPGVFDYFGSSHQLWHVFILLAFIWWYLSSFELIKYVFTTDRLCDF